MVFTARQPPEHRASNLMAVKPSSSITEPTGILRALETLERRTVLATFARLASTRTIREAAAAAMNLETTALKRYKVRGKVLPHRNMIEIETTGPDAEVAARLANAAAAATRTEAARLYGIYEMAVLEEAQARPATARPGPVRSSMASGVVGLFLGILGALFLHRVQAFPL
jgi:capsular polysaccharide biosynthesis protein